MQEFHSLGTYYAKLIRDCVDFELKDLVVVDPPKDEKFGDFSTNIAMIAAKKMNKSPIEIAESIVNQLRNNTDFEDLQIMKPAFINWRVPKNVLLKFIPDILKDDFGKIDIGNGKSVNIEFVSANPTGPLHAGHVRGAISGDVLASMLQFVGYNVTREFYINDAGRQIRLLAKSLYHRYLELFNAAKTSFPENGYPGEYLIDTAKKIAAKHGDKFVNASHSEIAVFFRTFAVEDILQDIKKDLHDLGVYHDIFISERQLVKSGAVDNVLDTLMKDDLIYRGVLPKPKSADVEDWEEHEQLLFKSTAFGDDIDRPLQKSDGSWTYFASDIAYHANKLNRGFDEIIDIWGADHGGYVKRMQAAISALSKGRTKLQVKLIQLVRLMDGNKEVRMSKRAGTFVTARDIIDKVGKDVIRFMMLTRKDDAKLDFDFQKVIDTTRDNPVFYVQYASARGHSVINQFKRVFGHDVPNIDAVNMGLLNSEAELKLLKTLADWPRQIMRAAQNREPHKIIFYLLDVATCFHALWTQGKGDAQLRFILQDNYDLTSARMIMIQAMLNVIGIALNIVGVTPVKEMQ